MMNTISMKNNLWNPRPIFSVSWKYLTTSLPPFANFASLSNLNSLIILIILYILPMRANLDSPFILELPPIPDEVFCWKKNYMGMMAKRSIQNHPWRYPLAIWALSLTSLNAFSSKYALLNIIIMSMKNRESITMSVTKAVVDGSTDSKAILTGVATQVKTSKRLMKISQAKTNLS